MAIRSEKRTFEDIFITDKQELILDELKNLNDIITIPEQASSEWVSALGDDLADDDYYYSGYIKVGTLNWRIVRQSKADFSIAWASGTAEDETELASVWANRATQTYNLNL